MTIEEATKSHDVVSGTFILNSIPVHVMFDYGASKSFVSLSLCGKLNVPPCKLSRLLEVEIVDDKLVLVNDVFRGCNLAIDDETFYIDLIPIKMGEFHVIVGMDWLGVNGGMIDCPNKMVHVRV
ncbi:uncharacterized protein [Rutidosis leptorrhynchoides]|uniref:uncharacterized protein n=1 Tax=Rutidosis leptorrhynchoides TaxID=125765 RepID=UPI003A9A5B23